MKSQNLGDDKLLISRAFDTLALSKKRHCACFLGFLNEHEAKLISDSVRLDDSCRFYGGYDGAQRVIFAAGCDSNTQFPISVLKFCYKKEYHLSHRDFLGAFMSLQIDRSTIGDILVGDGQTLAILKSDIAEFICSHISKIGSVGVEISVTDCDVIHYEPKFDELCLTLSSLRLDVFVSALCSLSRDKSSKLIKNELVCVNHITVTNVSKTLDVGNIITVRKYGKFVFISNDGTSKKGRLKVKVKHFR